VSPIASLTPRLRRALAVASATLAAAAGSLTVAAGPAAAAAAATPWLNVPVPQSAAFAQMSGASLVNAVSGWGVGTEGQTSDFLQPVIWRWTAAGWQLQDVPILPSSANLDVVSADQGHAWVAGFDYSQPGPGTGLNLYWDGSTWQRAASTASLFGVVATGSTAWAVGLSGSYPDQVPSIFRWTGTDWAVVRKPANLTGLVVSATSASDVWVAGTNGNGKAVVLHYDGTSWTRLKPLALGGADAIAAGSPGNVWVAGPLGVAHYNGATWSKRKLPWTGPYGPGTLAVDASGAPWLTVTTSLVANRSQYFHLVAGHWVQQLGPVHPQAIGMNTQTLTPVPGTCALLASGWAQVFNQPIVALNEVAPAAGCGSASAAAGTSALEAAVRAASAHPMSPNAAPAWPGAAAAPPSAAADPSWSVTPTPGAVQPLAALSGVGAAGPAAAWAVGYSLKGTLAPGDPLILRWNGTAWHQVALPGVNWTGSLTAVSGDSAADAWAVGQENPLAAALPRLLHWNGARWREVAFPGATSSATKLSAVDAVSPRDAWFAGSAPGGAPLLLQWNGTAVQPVTLPVTSGTLTGVRALGPGDVWAVGFQNTASGQQALALHWDGTTWQVLPAPPVASAQFSDVLPAADGTAWAVGQYTSGGFAPHFLLEHWDGSAWTQTTVPSSPIGALTSISADDQGNPEWIGAALLGATPTSAFLHYDGAAWQLVDGPAVPGEAGANMDVAHVPGTATTLAAGSVGLNGNYDQSYTVPLLESSP
jgi:hypothetical protein